MIRNEISTFEYPKSAFYDALEVNNSSAQVFGDETLKVIARSAGGRAIFFGGDGVGDTVRWRRGLIPLSPSSINEEVVLLGISSSDLASSPCEQR